MSTALQEKAALWAARFKKAADVDDVMVSWEERQDSFVRLGANTATTTGAVTQDQIVCKFFKDHKVASLALSALDEANQETVITKAKNILGALSEDPEFMPAPTTDPVLSVNAWDEAIARLDPAWYLSTAKEVIQIAERNKVSLAGFLEAGTRRHAQVSTAGFSAFYDETFCTYSCTARTNAGSGKGRIGHFRLADVDLSAITNDACEIAQRTTNAHQLPPGEYEVLLLPSAMADLLVPFVGYMDQRQADEGRSYFSSHSTATIDLASFPKDCMISSDPSYCECPSQPYTHDGIPRIKQTWLKDGKILSLPCDRYWAKKSHRPVIAAPSNIIMQGGSSSLEQLIAKVERGLLIHNLWYIRMVDPQQLLLTGLTRDGVFLIEQGKIVRPVNNFRFNESPARVLSNIVDLTPAKRATPVEHEGTKVVAPAALVKKFRLTSVSDAV